MLTLQDVSLLREALSYWARHDLGIELADVTGQANDDSFLEVDQDDLVALYEQLVPEHVRFIVVDGNTNHAINTRLFRKVPKLSPASGRWHVRTVIG